LNTQVIQDVLQEVFPGGRVEHVADPSGNGQTHFRIQRHFFVPRTNVLGQATLEWWAGPPWHQKAAKLDECPLTTRDDLIGWASFLWGKVVDFALGALADQFNPNDLFPQGAQRALQRKLEENVRVLNACGFGEARVVQRLAQGLFFPWLPTKNTSKYAFKVNGAFEGLVVGRLSPRLANTSTLEWAYDIPISVKHRLKARGEKSFPFPAVPLVITEVRVWLRQLYVRTLYEFVLQELRERP